MHLANLVLLAASLAAQAVAIDSRLRTGRDSPKLKAVLAPSTPADILAHAAGDVQPKAPTDEADLERDIEDPAHAPPDELLWIVEHNQKILLHLARAQERKEDDSTGSSERCRDMYPAKLIPFMSDAERSLGVKYAREYGGRGLGYFEWGSGGSTDVFTRAFDGPSRSVDNNREWCGIIQDLPYIKCRTKGDSKLPGAEKDMVYRCVDTGPTVKWGYPAAEEDVPKFEGYVSAIDDAVAEAGEEGAFFGMIFVDGRARVACALRAFAHMDPTDSVLLMHDYFDRSQYHVIERYFDIVDRAERMVAMKRKSDVTEIPAEEMQKYREIVSFF
jgi:hypothetical protein